MTDTPYNIKFWLQQWQICDISRDTLSSGLRLTIGSVAGNGETMTVESLIEEKVFASCHDVDTTLREVADQASDELIDALLDNACSISPFLTNVPDDRKRKS